MNIIKLFHLAIATATIVSSLATETYASKIKQLIETRAPEVYKIATSRLPQDRYQAGVAIATHAEKHRSNILISRTSHLGRAFGTGTYMETADGGKFILTAAHVLDGPFEMQEVYFESGSVFLRKKIEKVVYLEQPKDNQVYPGDWHFAKELQNLMFQKHFLRNYFLQSGTEFTDMAPPDLAIGFLMLDETLIKKEIKIRS